MDYSFLTFSPPKRNSRIPKLECKRRKSKSLVTSVKHLQSLHKVSAIEKFSSDLSAIELHGGCCTHSEHKSRGKENCANVRDRHFSNRSTSKLCSIKNRSKKVVFKPYVRKNCSLPDKDVTSNSSVLILDDSDVNTTGVPSDVKKADANICLQQASLVTSSVEIIDDGVVEVSDTSGSVGEIREALKLISVGEKGEATDSVCIVSESPGSYVCEAKDVRPGSVKQGTNENSVADISNIVPNTSSSDLSDTKTPARLVVKKTLFCTEPRTKGHGTRTAAVNLDNALKGSKIHVASSTFACVDGEGPEVDKFSIVKIQSESRRPRGKCRPTKPYKALLQNSFKLGLLRKVYGDSSDTKLADEGQKSKFLADSNVHSNTSGKLPVDVRVPCSKHFGSDVLMPNGDTDVDNQSGIMDHVPVAVSTPVMSSTKYKEVESWLNANDFRSASPCPLDSESNCSFSKTVNASTTPNKSDDFLSASMVEVLNNVYGTEWCSADIRKKCHTEPVLKHRPCRESKSPQIKFVNSNGQVKRSSSSSSGGEDNFSEFLSNIYSSKKQSKPARQLLSTPDFIDDDSIDNSPLQYLQSQSRDVKIEAKKTLQLFQKNKSSRSSNHGAESCAKQLHFSASESSCSENSIQPRTESTQNDVKSNKKIQTVKPSKSKKNVEVTPLVRREQNVRTRKASLHGQSTLSFLSSLSVPTPDGKCDSEALYFKKNFSKLKESLGKKLFQLYNEKVFENKLPHDMPLEWNVRMKQTAGFCYSKRSLSSTGERIRTSRISLSTKVMLFEHLVHNTFNAKSELYFRTGEVNTVKKFVSYVIGTADRLRDTLIHEMCHAAAWIVDMAKDGHGPRWKAWAKRAMTVFPELPPIRRCHDYKIHTKFTYRCVGCGYSFGRHSKSLNLTVKRCGYCFGEFELLVNTKNKAGAVVQAVKAHRSPRGFARFVKENYKTVKQAQPGLKHGDVMKLLGEQFKMKHPKPTK